MPLDPAPVIADALSKRTAKQSKTKKQRKPKAKKPRVPKLHRPKKESTKTITTRLYRTWAAIVHAYYGDRCAICGKENSKDAPLNAHHIMPRQMFSGLRFDPQNGIALCPKCHKMGKWSAHKGGIWFAEWLRNHAPEKYQHCIANAVFELDCKDRSKLYAIENDLHTRYADAIAPLAAYRVVGYDRKLNKVESVVSAYNNRAAEFLFWNSWPKSEIPLKGVHKTEELKVDHDAIAEHFKSLPITDWIPEEDIRTMTLDQLADHLTKEFVNQKMTDVTMRRMRFVFDCWCDAHEVDPEDYVIYGDCHGNVSILKKSDNPFIELGDLKGMSADTLQYRLTDKFYGLDLGEKDKAYLNGALWNWCMTNGLDPDDYRVFGSRGEIVVEKKGPSK